MVFSFISSSFLSLVSSEVEDSLSEFELVDEPAKIYLLHIFEAYQSHKSLVRFVAPLSTLTFWALAQLYLTPSVFNALF